MNLSPITTSKEYHLACHYLDRLRSAHQGYKSGGETMSHSIRTLELDWAQINHWHGWSVKQSSHHREVAELCSTYPHAAGDLLNIVLTPVEHGEWREQALAVAHELGDHRLEAAHLLALSEIAEKLDDYTRAAERAEQALKLARQIKDRQSQARALYLLGLINMRLGNYADAHGYYDKSLSLYHALHQPEGVAMNLMGLAIIYEMRGDRDAAVQTCEEVLQIRRRADDRPGIAEVLNLQAEHLMLRDEMEAARPYLEESLRIRREISDRKGIAAVLSNLARIAVMAPDFDAAVRYFEEALELARQMGSRKGVSANLLGLSGMAILQGKFGKALAYAEQTLLESREIRNRVGIVNSLVYMAYSYLGLDDLVNARQTLSEALRVVQEVGTTFLLPEIVMGIALLYLRTGRPEDSAVLAGTVEAYPNTHPVTRRFYLPFVKSQLKGVLAQEVYLAAKKRGQAMPLEDVASTLAAELVVH